MCFPVRFLLFSARRLGSLAYYVNFKRNKFAYSNLKAAFGKAKEPAELKKLTKMVYQNLMQNFFEVLITPKINKQYVEKYVTFVGIEHIEAAKKEGKGIIFMTGHFGNWELSNVISPFIGCPLSVLAREQKMPRLNALLNRYRESTGSRMIKKGASVRELVKCLKRNEIIGMLSDQDAGRTGVMVQFFGRLASTPDGPIAFAMKTGAVILPVFIVRKKGPHHIQHIEPQLKMDSTGNYELDLKTNLQKFTRILESYITRYPDQWLWLHKRWKSSPTKDVLILSDGKAGHLNQSLAVANIIKRRRSDQGFSAEDTRISIMEVKYKSDAGKNILALCSLAFSGVCQGCLSCMRFSLHQSSYDGIKRHFANIVISAGSSLAPVNLLASREYNAKSIVIMKPDIGIKKFDLAILPRHDNAKAKNVVITDGAPNLIEAASLQKDADRFAGMFDLSKKDKLGILIGGDNEDLILNKTIAENVISSVVRIAEELDMEILATTSRRTPKNIEELVEEKLSNNTRCKMLVIANRRNIDRAVNGILGLSKLVVVSGDSISMVSEATGSGKPAFVFRLSKKRSKKTKHELFLENLSRGGYIILTNAFRLYEDIKKVYLKREPTRQLDDFSRIYDAVGKLL